MVFGNMKVMIFASIVGILEILLLKVNIVLRLPLKLYGCIEKVIPKGIKLGETFTLIEDSRFDLLKNACEFCRVDTSYEEYEREVRERNPNPNFQKMKDRWAKQEDEEAE